MTICSGFLPGEFHVQKNLVGYSPWHNRVLDVTEYTHRHNCIIKSEIVGLSAKIYDTSKGIYSSFKDRMRHTQ